MFYSFDLTIPANTQKALPESLLCALAPGSISRVMLVFPTGAAKLAHVRISRSGHQVWPSNPDGDFSADGEVIDFGEDYEISDTPFELLLRGWNTDDTYDHTVTVRFDLESLGSGKVRNLTNQLKRSFGL